VGKRKDITYWNVPVDRSLNEALEDAVHRDWHMTKAEFVRGAVRRVLREMGYRPPQKQEEAMREGESQ